MRRWFGILIVDVRAVRNGLLRSERYTERRHVSGIDVGYCLLNQGNVLSIMSL